MKKRSITSLLTATALCTMLLAAGCQSTSRPVTYYGLNSLTTPQPPATATADTLPTVGIVQVGLPEYLDRPQLVTRLGPNQLQVDEFNQWAGPLSGEIERVLGENLVQMIGAEQVALRPWTSGFSPSKTVGITIFAFERLADGAVRLSATVTVAETASAGKPQTWSVDLQEEPQGRDYADMVAAQSRLLAELSRQIADAVLASPRSSR